MSGESSELPGTAFLDQLLAAKREVDLATQIFWEKAAQTAGSAIRNGEEVPGSGWSGRQLQPLWPSWRGGVVPTSGAPPPSSAGPGALMSPCARAARSIDRESWLDRRRISGSEEDLRCDACGSIGDHIHLGASTVGPVIVYSGVCCSCLEENGGGCSPTQT